MFQLEELGWSSFFEEQIDPEERELYSPARVAEETKKFYRVYAECGELLSEVSGKLLHQAASRQALPAVGDWVLVHARATEGRATIHRVLRRKSKFSRKVAGKTTAEQILAANVDTLFLVIALDRDFNLRRIERYLTLVWESGARPVILLNKADLCDEPQARALDVEVVASGVPVHLQSAINGEGLEALERYLRRGQTAALLGSSGVGKSTLINRLAGRELQRVQEINVAADRGRHTTSSRQLILLPAGGVLIDTPGMRELQLWGSAGSLPRAFEDIAALAAGCRFRDCQHRAEPGCAVQQALQEGIIDPDRWENYLKLEKELHYLALKQDARARLAEQNKWKKIIKEQKRNKKGF